MPAPSDLTLRGVSERHAATLAVPTGFEPAISSLTGTYARPLHHGTVPETRAFLTRAPLCASILPPGHQKDKEAASALPFTRRPCRCGQRLTRASSPAPPRDASSSSPRPRRG